MTTSLALDGSSKSAETNRYSVVCSPTFAQVWIFGITPLPHTVVLPTLVQTPFKCFHLDQQIAKASDECWATPVSVSCPFLSVLSCECDYAWVRNLLPSFSGLKVAVWHVSRLWSAIHMLSCSHFWGVIQQSQQARMACEDLSRGVSQLLRVYWSFSGLTCLFSLEKVMIFNEVENMCWGCFNEYRK